MAKHPPAFQFYPADFIGGTSRLTTTEVGGYILLLCEQWTQGGIPGDNTRQLAQIMRCTPQTAKSIWASIAEKFVRDEDGIWRNRRMECVRAEQEAYRQRKERAGHASATARQQKANTTPTEPQQKANPSSPSSPPEDQIKERSDQRDAQFSEFWRIYPNRKAKADALRAWKVLRPDATKFSAILAAVETQKRSPEWLKEGGRFIPYPATWIRAGRWEDEMVEDIRQQQQREGAIELQRFKEEAAARWRA